MRKLMFLTFLGLLSILGLRYSLSIVFDQEVGGHLKRAADANSVALAQDELARAIAGAEARHLCNGGGECYTTVFPFLRTPDEDMAFWRKNLDQSLAALRALPPTVDPLTQSNALMKLRETLLDRGKDGDEVTVPRGISRYPNNGLIGFATILFLLVNAGIFAGIRYGGLGDKGILRSRR